MSRNAVITLFVGVTANFACSDAAPPAAGKPRETFRRVTADELKLDETSGTAVISSAQKFIIPVPVFGSAGEPLRYPASHEKAGQPIVDFEGKPIGERGLVFFNDKDKTIQAVAGDGEGVIIINEVTEQQADRLDRKLAGLAKNLGSLTPGQLKDTLEFARNDLQLGDMYNSTRSFVRTRMTPAVPGQRLQFEAGQASGEYGFKKRDDRDICHAVYIAGALVFEGPAASEQVFEEGAVIVKQGTDVRGVQPDIFARTYRLADGRAITSVSTELKVWRPAR